MSAIEITAAHRHRSGRFAPSTFVAAAVLCGVFGGSGCAAPIAPGDAGIADVDASPALRDAGATLARPDGAMREISPAACEGVGCAVVDVAAGRAHTCARRANGDVICWGRNRWGELGDGSGRHQSCTNRGDIEETDCSGSPVAAGVSDVVSLSARASASNCALATDGTISCWGVGFTLREGGPTLESPRFDPESTASADRFVDVSEGPRHTCAVTSRGEVVCRGLGFAGQLGRDDMLDREAFGHVVGIEGATDVEVSAGGDFSCALTAHGVFCWGDGSSDQLGDGGRAHESCGGGVSRFDCAPSPIRVGGLDDAVAISLGAGHACALEADGDVLCWGENAQGQLGVPDVDHAATPIAVHAASPAVAISAGATFTCAVRDDGAVLCWGDDGFGQLGDGDALDGAETCVRRGELTSCKKSPTRVLGIEDAVTVSAGAAHACALDARGLVSCWGSNDGRQLGDGTREGHAAPTIVEL